MNGTTSTLVKTITAAGAIGLVLIMAFLLWFVIGKYDTTVSNHIQHSTEVLVGLKSSIDTSNVIDKEQIQVMRELKEVIQYSR